MVHERRASKRIEASLPLHYKIKVPDQPPESGVEGNTTTRNLGLGGALLKWSAWWKCPACPHAVEPEKRPPCGLGMCQFDALDEILVESGQMELQLELPSATVEVDGRIIWVRKPGRRSAGSVAVEFASVPAEAEAALAEFLDSEADEDERAPAGQALSKLVVTSGPMEGSEFVLEKRSFTIGRSQDNDLAVANLRVSREHAVLRVGAKAVTVYDLGSTNGTYVNGERIAKAALRNNDKITIGPISLMFRAPSAVLAVSEE